MLFAASALRCWTHFGEWLEDQVLRSVLVLVEGSSI